jgi:hypothetical protein
MRDIKWKILFLQPVQNPGDMSEWSNEPAWKAGVLATVPRVRIPLSPLKILQIN